MSREKCQPEHFTLADKESGAVISAAVVPPRDAGSKEEVDLFYFYFPGSKRQILLELWNMNSSISSRYILCRNWRLRTFSSIFFFLERNNKKWVIIIGHEQQFIIGSSLWLGEKKGGGAELRIVHSFLSAVHLTEQPSTEPMYILNIN